MQDYKKLEEKFAKFAGTKYAVSVNTGTGALHLALVALGIGRGDEVIVPDFTMAATAFAVSYTGAKPVFVDCDDTLCIDTSRIEEKITKKTKAIMPVHIYGRVANMKEINRIAKKHKLKVIEDACEVHGAKVGPSDACCYSFYRNKIIHAEEGGIICTNSLSLYNKMQDLKSMAFGKKHDFHHKSIGFNYRMTNSQAKLALKSLRDFPKNIKIRRNYEKLLDKLLGGYSYMDLPPREVVWVYDVVIKGKNNIVNKLPFSRHFFKPMTSMPMYYEKNDNYKARFYANNGMYIRIDPNLSKKQVIKEAKRVIMAINANKRLSRKNRHIRGD